MEAILILGLVAAVVGLAMLVGGVIRFGAGEDE